MSLEQQFKIVVVASGVLAVIWVVVRVRRFFRGRHLPHVHPDFQDVADRDQDER